MFPRGASRRTVRIWLFSAAFSYFVPERICSDQRRRKRTEKTTSAIAARIATRSAIRGVNRYGSSIRGSGGRKRPPPVVGLLANGVDPLDAVAALERAQQDAGEAVEGPGQDQVEQDALEERRPEHGARGRGLAEHEVEGERAERVQERDHRDGDEGRVC